MDEHRPKVRGITETAAKAASAAAKAKAAREQSNGNTHESHHEAGDIPAGVKNAAGDAVEHIKAAAGEALASGAENIGEPAGDGAAAAAEALLGRTRRGGARVLRSAGSNPLPGLLVAGAVGDGPGYLPLRSPRT